MRFESAYLLVWAEQQSNEAAVVGNFEILLVIAAQS